MAELTRADLRSLVERNLDAWQRHDVAALVASHATDAIVESPMFGTRRGRTELEESYRAFFKSFPDVTLSSDALLVDPPHVAVFTQFGGTHMDEFFGLPGTNKHVDMRVARFLVFDDSGLIALERRIYDFTGLLLQIGVLRAKPAKP
jgi:steroid delta-isomerase-like uncharacterized protein